MLYINIFILFVLQVNCDITSEQQFACTHNIIKADELVTGVHLEESNSSFTRVKRKAENFRIHFHYTDLMLRDQEFSEIESKILIPARDVISSAIRPKIPVSGKLLVDRKCIDGLIVKQDGKIVCKTGCNSDYTCANVVIPGILYKKCARWNKYGGIAYEGYDGLGVDNTDLIIIVDRRSCSGDTYVYSNSCFLEDKLDRPILGVINLCSNGVSLKPDNTENVKIVVHQIIHVLGFSVSEFAFFRDKNGDPLVPRNSFNLPNLGVNADGYYNFNSKIARLVSRKRSYYGGTTSKVVYGLTLPNVVKEARSHFDCDNINEVDLEDYGNSGTRLNHFDKLFLKDELMSPMFYNTETYLTKMTLAFLYDTGWYDVHYCGAESMPYGANSGCTLPLTGCYEYMRERKTVYLSIDPFCENIYTKGYIYDCNPDKSLIKYCYIRHIENLPFDKRYFSNSTLGTPDPYAEYCPVYRFKNCRNEDNNGLNSKCYRSLFFNSITYGATCHKTFCSSMDFLDGANIYSCLNKVSVRTSSGTVYCGSKEDYCPTTEVKQCLENWKYNKGTKFHMMKLSRIIMIITVVFGYFL